MDRVPKVELSIRVVCANQEVADRIREKYMPSLDAMNAEAGVLEVGGQVRVEVTE